MTYNITVSTYESPETAADADSLCCNSTTTRYNHNNNRNRNSNSDNGNNLTTMLNDDRTTDISSISINDIYDVKDSVNIWSEAVVCKIDYTLNAIYISYLNWDAKYDEWITNIGERVAPLHTHTYYVGGPFGINQRIRAKDARGRWLEAKIIDCDVNRIKVHYMHWDYKFDTWIDTCSNDIRPFDRFNKNYNSSSRPPGSCSNVMTHRQQMINTKIWKIPSSGYAGDVKQQTSSHASPSAAAVDSIVRHTRHVSEKSVQYDRYIKALRRNNLQIHTVLGDGNCLFRAIAHQIYGDDSLHDLVRQKCMDYMEAQSQFFSQFIEGGLDTFHLYIRAKRRLTCWGDDPELQALCELYQRPCELWAYDHTIGARKLRTFHENTIHDCEHKMKVSYYGGGHYDSVIRTDCAGVFLDTTPGIFEDKQIAKVIRLTSKSNISSNSAASNDNVVEDTKRLTDIEATDQLTLDAALQTSRNELQHFNWVDDDLDQLILMSVKMSSTSATTAAADSKNDDISNKIVNCVKKESDKYQTEEDLIEHVRLESIKDIGDKVQYKDSDVPYNDEALQVAINSSVVDHSMMQQQMSIDYIYDSDVDVINAVMQQSYSDYMDADDDDIRKAIAESLK